MNERGEIKNRRGEDREEGEERENREGGMCILLVTKALTSLTPSVNYSVTSAVTEERKEKRVGGGGKEGRGRYTFWSLKISHHPTCHSELLV